MLQPGIKFIAADMDGTLLDDYGHLDPEFFDVLSQLEMKGVLFSVASGRQYSTLMDIFSPMHDRLVYVAENGALVMYKGIELYSCTIEKTDIIHLIRVARKLKGANLVVCGKHAAYIETRIEHEVAALKKYYPECCYVDDLLLVKDEFIKVAICHLEGIDKLYPAINHQFKDSLQVVKTTDNWLDVMQNKVTKGAAIRYLQTLLGFDSEQTMVFGDYFNDLEMLQASYHSYAMANAHDAIKQVARFRAPSNRESGVLQVIKAEVL